MRARVQVAALPLALVAHGPHMARSTSAYRILRVGSLFSALCIGALIWSGASSAAPLAITRTLNTGEPTGKFSLTPSRFEGNVIPGQPLVIPIQLYNGLDSDVHVAIEAVEIGPSKVPTSLIQVVDSNAFSAASWIDLQTPELDVARNETVAFDLLIKPPLNLPPGTNFAGLQFSVIPKGSAQNGSKLAFRFSGLMQLFLTGPGTPQRSLKVRTTRVSDSLMLGGVRYVTYEVAFANAGNVNEHVSGSVAITSVFGNSVATLPIKRMIILRGSERTVRVTWTKPPMFGRFSARVTAHSDATRVQRDLPTVTILPPWWWLLIIAVTLITPIAFTVYRRRSWRRYLDEEWDDAWLEDDWDYEPGE